MKKIYTYMFLCMMLMLTSCTKEFYQILTTKSDSVISKSDNLIYEDENCMIVYNLWASCGNAGFLFYNKTEENIAVNLKECFFVFNGQALDYYRNRTYTYSKSASAGISNSLGKSASYSEALSKTIYGNWLGYNASASSGVSGSIDIASSSSISSGTSAHASIEIKEQDLVCIPPRSSKLIYEYQIMERIYRECGFLLAPQKSQTKHLSYTKDNSPIRFSNIISYTIGEAKAPIIINNDFYVVDITNISANKFSADIKINKDCMDKRFIKPRYKTICPEEAADKFYIKYFYNSKNSDRY